jgi:hypothetical protein
MAVLLAVLLAVRGLATVQNAKNANAQGSLHQAITGGALVSARGHLFGLSQKSWMGAIKG